MKQVEQTTAAAAASGWWRSVSIGWVDAIGLIVLMARLRMHQPVDAVGVD